MKSTITHIGFVFLLVACMAIFAGCSSSGTESAGTDEQTDQSTDAGTTAGSTISDIPGITADMTDEQKASIEADYNALTPELQSLATDIMYAFVDDPSLSDAEKENTIAMQATLRDQVNALTPDDQALLVNFLPANFNESVN